MVVSLCRVTTVLMTAHHHKMTTEHQYGEHHQTDAIADAEQQQNEYQKNGNMQPMSIRSVWFIEVIQAPDRLCHGRGARIASLASASQRPVPTRISKANFIPSPSQPISDKNSKLIAAFTL
tara:strand:- start:10 stop:372 length:363 start_codon:yes stop_codon:yes gene_type:complete